MGERPHRTKRDNCLTWVLVLGAVLLEMFYWTTHSTAAPWTTTQTHKEPHTSFKHPLPINGQICKQVGSLLIPQHCTVFLSKTDHHLKNIWNTCSVQSFGVVRAGFGEVTSLPTNETLRKRKSTWKEKKKKEKKDKSHTLCTHTAYYALRFLSVHEDRKGREYEQKWRPKRSLSCRLSERSEYIN